MTGIAVAVGECPLRTPDLLGLAGGVEISALYLVRWYLSFLGQPELSTSPIASDYEWIRGSCALCGLHHRATCFHGVQISRVQILAFYALNPIQVINQKPYFAL